MLLVDDGMNATDIDRTRIFFKTLTAYAENHAVLVVSHQPRTLLRADYVYVLEASGIVEAGTPVGLLQRDREFASLISADTVATCTA